MDTPIALITGGSRGLGRSMALHLAAQGSDLIMTYKDNASAAREVVARVTEQGRKAVALQLDVGDTRAFAAFVDEVRGALASVFGRDRLDHLVHNAGTGLHAPFSETKEGELDDLYACHLKGPFFLTQKLLPLIADGGRIINISSGLTRFASPGSSAYAAMKGALEVLTRYLARELGARRITVNTVAPGAIATDFRGGAVRDNPELSKMIASMTALGRVGLPDDVGGAVAALLRPEAGWITAQRIEVSGGMLI